MDRISLLLGSIRCFPISINTFNFRWLLMELVSFMSFKITNKNLKKTRFCLKKGQGTPWEVKAHMGAPWWQKGTAPF
jgi:hypothetical protein